MALDMRVEITSGVGATEIPDDVATDLEEAYEVLTKLPVTRRIAVDFPTPAEARLFVRQGKAWALAQDPPLTFVRKGDVKGLPTRVSFRIYLPRPDAPGTDTPATAA